MLKLGWLTERNCGGVSRREVLQVGAAGALGLSLAHGLPAAAAEKDVSVLVVFLRGGVAQMDTWDMKPEAPTATARGEFKPIETNVSGIQFCELLPKMARHADKLSVIRGASHHEGEHDNAMQFVLTGSHPSAGTVFPNMGAVVGKYKPGHSTLPSVMHVGTPGLGNPMAPPATPEQRGLSGGFMGAAHNPFMIPDIEKIDAMDWLGSTAVPAERLDRRRELMASLDRLQRSVETSSFTSHSTAYERAFNVVTSPEAKRAFKLEEEPQALREKYGLHEFGQSCLMARRLIETGVRYVQVNWSARGWDAITKKCDLFTRSTFDSHFAHFPWLRRQLPRLDDGMGALLGDMADRGLFQKTLLVVLTEFGRAPGINGDGGREHWPQGYTILMAGAGLPGGRVLGATDENGAYVVDGRFEPQQLLNSVYEICGLDVPVTLRQAGIVRDTSEGIPGLHG